MPASRFDWSLARERHTLRHERAWGRIAGLTIGLGYALGAVCALAALWGAS